MSNFVHAKEATQWFSFMNKEVSKFSRKYTTGYKFPLSWFGNFLKNHLYTQYYGWLDKVFVVHQKTYGKAFDRNFRQYKATKKNYAVISGVDSKKPFLKAA